MTTLIPAQRTAPTTENAPDAATYARWAYEAHTATCRHGDLWRDAGRAYLAATAVHDDLPGYGQTDSYPAI